MLVYGFEAPRVETHLGSPGAIYSALSLILATCEQFLGVSARS